MAEPDAGNGTVPFSGLQDLEVFGHGVLNVSETERYWSPVESSDRESQIIPHLALSVYDARIVTVDGDVVSRKLHGYRDILKVVV